MAKVYLYDLVLMRRDESEDYNKISNHILGKRVDFFSNCKVSELRPMCYFKSENTVFFSAEEMLWCGIRAWRLAFKFHEISEGQKRCVAYTVKSVIGWDPSWILCGSYSW